ncbi:MAG: hypothetical protein WBE90_07960 [Xanthobacteraceae bacterium]
MTVLNAAMIAVVAVLIAATVERLMRQYRRKLTDDCSRIEAAKTALIEQQRLIDRIIVHKNISENIKAFVLEVSGVIPSQKMAYKVAAWINDGMPDVVDKDSDEAKETNAFFDNLRSLRQSDQEAFELINSALRGAFVTMMLQWPTTARCLQRLYYKFAVESTTEVVKSAAAVQHAARHKHWVDAEPIAA